MTELACDPVDDCLGFLADTSSIPQPYFAPIRSAIAPGTGAMNERRQSTSSWKASSGRYSRTWCIAFKRSSSGSGRFGDEAQRQV